MDKTDVIKMPGCNGTYEFDYLIVKDGFRGKAVVGQIDGGGERRAPSPETIDLSRAIFVGI